MDFDVVEQRPDSRPNMRLVRVSYRPSPGDQPHTNIFHMQLYPTGRRLIKDGQGRLVTEGGKLVVPDGFGGFPQESPDDLYRRENFTRNNDAEMVRNIEAYWERKLQAAAKGKPYPQHHNTTLNLQVDASADSGQHRGGDHSLFLTEVAEAVGNNASSGTFTLFDTSNRFTGATIPVGETIDAATLTFTPASSASGTVVNSNIRAHLDANSGQIANETAWHDDFADSDLTVAFTAWDSIPAWTVDVEETSLDFAAVIQEVVDLGGWVSGNPLHIFWLNDGSTLAVGVFRNAWTVDGDTEKAPKLDIDHSPTATAEVQIAGAQGGNIAVGRGEAVGY